MCSPVPWSCILHSPALVFPPIAFIFHPPLSNSLYQGRGGHVAQFRINFHKTRKVHPLRGDSLFIEQLNFLTYLLDFSTFYSLFLSLCKYSKKSSPGETAEESSVKESKAPSRCCRCSTCCLPCRKLLCCRKQPKTSTPPPVPPRDSLETVNEKTSRWNCCKRKKKDKEAKEAKEVSKKNLKNAIFMIPAEKDLWHF